MSCIRNLAMLAVAAAIIPACGTQTTANGLMVSVIPGAVAAPDANVPLQCEIFFFFSAPINPASVSTTNFFVSAASGGAPLGNTSVTYRPQCQDGPLVILNIGLPYLTEGANYIATATSSILDTTGNPLPLTQVPFTATSTAALTGPVNFGGVVNSGVGAPGTGQITLTWAAATGGNNANYTYQVYPATVSGGEDPVANYTGPGVPFQSTSGTMTLSSGVPYWFIVRAQDGDGNMDSNLIEIGPIVAP